MPRTTDNDTGDAPGDAPGDATAGDTKDSEKVIKFKRTDCTSLGIYILLFVLLILFLVIRFFFG